MISLISVTALFAIGNSQTVSCDTGGIPPQDVTAGNTITLDLLVSETGLFFFSGCDDATTVDFSLQIFEMDGTTPFGDPCPGTAACMQPEGCFEDFTGTVPPNFEGFLEITNTGATDGQVQVMSACAQTTVAPDTTEAMTTTEMMMTTDSPDSSESPDSTDSTDSTDSPDSSEATDSPDSLESSDSPSDDEDESVSSESSEEAASVNDELIEEESPEDGEADANGRSAELNAAAAGQAANESMPFWQWVWIIVAVFVLLNFGLCCWLYTLKQNQRKSRVSFDATGHDHLNIEME